MEEFDKEVLVLSYTSPERIQSPNSISFLPDNRIIVCCSDVLILVVIGVDQNYELSHKSGPKAGPLIINTTRIIYRSQLPSFSFSVDVLDFVSSLKNISRDERHLFAIDPLLFTDSYFPRTDLGGFRSVRSSPFCSVNDNGILLGIVTFDHTSFILEEKEDKWNILLSLNQLVKDLVLFQKNTPMELEKDLTLEEYKDLINSMAYCELAWSPVFKSSKGAVNKEDKKFILFFSGMRNGDVHIWQVNLPLKTVDDFVYVKTEKCLSEVSALFFHPVSNLEGYLCVGSMDGNVKLFNLNLQGNVTVTQVYADDHNDSLLIQAFACTEITGSHVLVTAKQYFLLFHMIQNDKIKLLKTIHLDCSSPVGSISMLGKMLSASSEDGSIFEYVVDVDHDHTVSIELKQRKSLNVSKPISYGLACKGLSLSSNGAIAISAFQPENEYIFSKKKSKIIDMQNIVLFIPKTFSINYFIENESNLATSQTNFQDAIVSVCTHFQNKIRAYQLNEDDKMTLKKLIKSDTVGLLQIAKTLVCYLKYKSGAKTSELQFLEIDDNFDYKQLELRILAKHALNCLQFARKQNLEDRDLGFLSSMSSWIKYFGATGLEDMKDAEIWQKYSDINPLKCSLCQDEIKTFDDPLSVICVKGHKAKLSCLTLTPIHGLTIRKCFSCGTVAEYSKVLSSVPFLMDLKSCTLCGGHLRM